MFFSWKFKGISGSDEERKTIKEKIKISAKHYDGYGTIDIHFFLFFCIILYKTEMEFFGNTKGSDHFDKHSIFMIGRLINKKKNGTMVYRGFTLPDIKYVFIFIILPIIISVIYSLAYKNFEVFLTVLIFVALYCIFFFLPDCERGKEYKKLLNDFLVNAIDGNNLSQQNDIFNL